MTTECVDGDYRVTIYQFSNARSQHYHMAFFLIKSLVLKWNHFFLSGIIVFVEYFNLYMKQLGFNPGPVPAEECHRGLEGLCHDLRGYQA